MTTAPTRPPANRKSIVLASAARLFAERGFAAVNMIRIAENVGITAGALYRHYPGKQVPLGIAFLGKLPWMQRELAVPPAARRRAPRSAAARRGLRDRLDPAHRAHADRDLTFSFSILQLQRNVDRPTNGSIKPAVTRPMDRYTATRATTNGRQVGPEPEGSADNQ